MRCFDCDYEHEHEHEHEHETEPFAIKLKENEVMNNLYVLLLVSSGPAGFVRRAGSSHAARPGQDFRAGRSNPPGKIGYLRTEIPKFAIPPYKGERYEDTVPATYDIAERAMWAIQGFTGPASVDAGLDYEIYFGFNGKHASTTFAGSSTSRPCRSCA